MQSGKTLSTVVIPALWHLFEWRESVILGVPSMDMAYDKWSKEFLPVILASPKLRGYLPDKGRGSRGGTFDSITFANGATLKIMSGHGGDEHRSAYTARVVVITEADKMDQAGESSRETDPISQLEARTASYADDKRIYLECTVSIEEGRIWREYEGGTHTQIVCRCPECGADQTPERDQLGGWQDAVDEMAASAEAAFFCVECGIVWDEDQRRQANLNSRAVVRRERTNTFSYRWSGFHNLFWPAGWIGAKEWKRAQHIDEDLAAEALEKELRQFVWALPAEPDKFAAIELDARAICERHASTEVDGSETLFGGIVPSGAELLTMGIDLGKYHLHWVLIAWLPEGIAYVVQYGVWDVPGSSMAVHKAVLTGLLSFADAVIKPGWPDLHQTVHWPTCVLVDAGYQPDSVYAFVRKMRQIDPRHPRRFLPAIGRGTSQQKSAGAPLAKQSGGKTVHRGEFYEVKKFPDRGNAYGLEINADHWKSITHERLATPAGDPGSLVFHHVHSPQEHLTIAKHLTNEKVVQEYVPGKGMVDKWVNESRRPNHFFDATYNALVGGHICGVGVDRDNGQRSTGQAVAPRKPFTLPDGRPYFVGERS